MQRFRLWKCVDVLWDEGFTTNYVLSEMANTFIYSLLLFFTSSLHKQQTDLHRVVDTGRCFLPATIGDLWLREDQRETSQPQDIKTKSVCVRGKVKKTQKKWKTTKTRDGEKQQCLTKKPRMQLNNCVNVWLLTLTFFVKFVHGELKRSRSRNIISESRSFGSFSTHMSCRAQNHSTKLLTFNLVALDLALLHICPSETLKIHRKVTNTHKW